MTGLRLRNGLRLFFWGALVVFSFGAAGEICGNAFENTVVAFNTSYPENNPDHIGQVMARIGKPTQPSKPGNAAGIPMAVVVTDEKPRSLVALNLRDGSAIWKRTMPVQSNVTLAADLAIFQSDGRVIALDSSNGEERWSIPIKNGWNYIGADAHGDMAVIATGVGGKRPGDFADGRVVGVKASNGIQRWEHESGGGLLGEPSIYNDTVFVPWDRQKIAVLDAKKGEEICRILALDYTISSVDAEPSGVFFGSVPSETMPSMLFRFNAKTATGRREGSTVFAPNLKPIPGDPPFKRDSFAGQSLGQSASGKISLHWQPRADRVDVISMENDQFYLHYWRYLIAFDVHSNQVLWTAKSDATIAHLEVVEGGVVAVDAKGRFFFLASETGRVTWSSEIGHRVLNAAFDAVGFRPAGDVGTRVPAHQGLMEIVGDKDNRMLPIRSYATMLLAQFQDPIVTRDLLLVYTDPATPEGLRHTVARALELRSTGSEYLVQALDIHYDFLEQTDPAPMDVIAPALITTKERSAVPGLLEQLTDHETPLENLPLILKAIIELGDPSVLPTLKRFVILYHADSSFLENEYTLAIAAEGILKFDDAKRSEEFVAKIRDDNQTLPELKYLLYKILDPNARKKPPAPAPAAAAPAPAPAPKANKAPPAKGKPQTLSPPQINETMNAHQDRFKTCVADAMTKMPTLKNIKLRFTITGKNGKTSNLHVLPGNVRGLEECMAQALKKVKFQRFKNTRQMATYEISIQ